MSAIKNGCDYIGFDNERGALGIYTHGYTTRLNNNDERIFKQLIKVGAIKKGDPKMLAAMFCGTVIMYMGIWDREPDRARECEKAIMKHVEQFYLMTSNGENTETDDF